MKIAYMSPLPPLKTGIADYSEELLNELKNYTEIQLFMKWSSKITPSLTSEFDCLESSSFPDLYKSYDFVIYHMGNHYIHHNYIYNFLLKYPGVVVLHDFSLHNLIAARLLANSNDRDGYIKEMRYCHGPDGEKVAREILNGARKAVWETGQTIDYPLNKRVLETSRGVIVHSNFAEKRLNEGNFTTPVLKTNLPAKNIEYVNKKEILKMRKKYKLKPNCFIIGSFGYVTKTKRIDKVLISLKSIIEDGLENIILLIVGHKEDGYDIKSQVKELNLSKHVKIIESADLDVFVDLIKASDVCVNLRYPTQGETSASLLRIMGMGKPCLVTRVGSFNEIPNDTVIKIDYSYNEIKEITFAIKKLYSESSYKKMLGKNSYKYVSENCSYSKTAREYIDFLNDINTGKVFSGNIELNHNLIKLSASKLKETGMNIKKYDIMSFAKKIEGII